MCVLIFENNHPVFSEVSPVEFSGPQFQMTARGIAALIEYHLVEYHFYSTTIFYPPDKVCVQIWGSWTVHVLTS